MRCKECDYPLWNLRARQCPECGLPFRPDDFEFRPNAVCFCCPHCNQSYYGTDAKGHLEPAAFECVTCGRHVVMNEMVLLPAEGLDEKHTRAATNPWLERHREGWWRSWFRSVGQSLVSPGQFMRGTPVESSMKQAWWFLTVTLVFVSALSFIPAVAFSMAMPALMMTGSNAPAGGPGAGLLAAMMGITMAVMFILMIPIFMVYVVLWGLVTHGVLKMGRTGIGTIRRTFQALCYSTGAYVTAATPCLGSYIGPVWWSVSAILMVREGHKVSGLRATFAVLMFPVGSLILFVGLYILLIVAVIAAAAPAGMASQSGASTRSTTAILDGVLDHAAANNGAGPRHALNLVETTSITAWDFVDSFTVTDVTDVPVSGVGSLLDFAVLAPQDSWAAADDAAADLPENVVAHRVGDYVFTYHGMDLTTAKARLWVVVMSPDPAMNPATGPIIVGTVDGDVQPVPRYRVAEALARQNVLREREGLPPIPDPTQVTHDAPATGDP